MAKWEKRKKFLLDENRMWTLWMKTHSNFSYGCTLRNLLLTLATSNMTMATKGPIWWDTNMSNAQDFFLQTQPTLFIEVWHTAIINKRLPYLQIAKIFAY